MPLGLSPPTCVNAAVSSSISDFSYNTPPVAPWPATDGGRVGGGGVDGGGKGGGEWKRVVVVESESWERGGFGGWTGWVGLGWGGVVGVVAGGKYAVAGWREIYIVAPLLAVASRHHCGRWR